ncbi:MAG: hypothetical protein UW30_C0007G0016 [Candidatus Giovannonibacteria bacterium GW2011_GWA2_44_13b]|uniref:Uncharacterized protein n=1 Tax=Candidatus Giovannonibacteria bacterium GW2011_GWA2_44_13b TaxID=1618647 RepID=A0A0G1K153_9BACT|nr:MAG: hypothetical protein UW30_C0007G0016 [Candidatus Giovannonibacteria bacterium GW2011_GWA2_44_13b]
MLLCAYSKKRKETKKKVRPKKFWRTPKGAKRYKGKGRK